MHKKRGHPPLASLYLEVLEHPGQQTEKIVPTLQKNCNPGMRVRWRILHHPDTPGIQFRIISAATQLSLLLANQMKFSRFQDTKRQSVSDAFYT